MDDVLFHAVMKDPPTRYVLKKKKVRFDKDGKLVEQSVYYLTANLFYDGTHWAIKYEVINFAKDWVLWYLKTMPKIEKCKIEITYHFPTDQFDLDNKLYFWIKIILDLMKTPSTKQIINAEKFKNPIKTLEVLNDDTVRFVNGINMRYVRGEAALELKIIGTRAEVQQSLF